MICGNNGMYSKCIYIDMVRYMYVHGNLDWYMWAFWFDIFSMWMYDICLEYMVCYLCMWYLIQPQIMQYTDSTNSSFPVPNAG